MLYVYEVIDLTEKVNIKSNGKHLEFWLSEHSSYQELRTALIEKLSVNKDFYSKMGKRVIFYGKIFSAAQKKELKNTLMTDFDMTDVYFVDDDVPQTVKNAPPVKADAAPAPALQDEELNLVSTKYFDAQSIVVNQTVRNGMRIECEGDVVIVGDVNAGAEIIAGGSVAVFGRLRGLVHAGAKGRKDVLVVANSLQANQIRIAGKIAILPAKRQVDYIETAKLEDDRIVITALN